MNIQNFGSKLAQVNIGDTFNSTFSRDPGNAVPGKGIADLVSLGLNVAFVISGIIILFFIVLAGFKIIQGAGSGNQQDTEKAKQAMTSAAIGFVIIFTAFWIIKIIEILTGETFITNPGF